MGPRNAKFYMSCIRGSVALLACTVSVERKVHGLMQTMGSISADR
jgi:hypothetical protein